MRSNGAENFLDLFDKEKLVDAVDGFASPYDDGRGDIKVSLVRIDQIATDSKLKFLYPRGIDEASCFKVAANFICHFVANKPLSGNYPEEWFDEFIKNNIDNYQNAVTAYHIAHAALVKSKIHWKDGSEKIILNPMKLSRHSYCDVIQALSNVEANPKDFALVSLLLEQMVYRTNPHCEYKQ